MDQFLSQLADTLGVSPDEALQALMDNMDAVAQALMPPDAGAEKSADMCRAFRRTLGQAGYRGAKLEDSVRRFAARNRVRYVAP